jgi:hypothetical protein
VAIMLAPVSAAVAAQGRGANNYRLLAITYMLI